MIVKYMTQKIIEREKGCKTEQERGRETEMKK